MIVVCFVFVPFNLLSPTVFAVLRGFQPAATRFELSCQHVQLGEL
jgi:hypothetical protein